MIKEFNGYKEEDLKITNQIITNLMIDDSGKYRMHAEGVFNGENVIFIAPPLLIKSCVFHYEFVFIHPFNEESGRAARLW